MHKSLEIKAGRGPTPDGPRRRTLPELNAIIGLLIDVWDWIFPDWLEIDPKLDDVYHRERVWVYNEMTKGAPAWESRLLQVRRFHAGWGPRNIPDGDGQVEPIGSVAANGLSSASLISSPIFRPFESEDQRCPAWALPDANWLYMADGEPAINTKLPPLPFTLITDEQTRMNMIKNHAKLLAEAIPALSGPTGGSKLSKIGGADLNSDTFK